MATRYTPSRRMVTEYVHSGSRTFFFSGTPLDLGVPSDPGSQRYEYYHTIGAHDVPPVLANFLDIVFRSELPVARLVVENIYNPQFGLLVGVSVTLFQGYSWEDLAATINFRQGLKSLFGVDSFDDRPAQELTPFFWPGNAESEGDPPPPEPVYRQSAYMLAEWLAQELA